MDAWRIEGTEKVLVRHRVRGLHIETADSPSATPPIPLSLASGSSRAELQGVRAPREARSLPPKLLQTPPEAKGGGDRAGLKLMNLQSATKVAGAGPSVASSAADALAIHPLQQHPTAASPVPISQAKQKLPHSASRSSGAAGDTRALHSPALRLATPAKPVLNIPEPKVDEDGENKVRLELHAPAI